MVVRKLLLAIAVLGTLLLALSSSFEVEVSSRASNPNDDCYIYCTNQGWQGGYCMTKAVTTTDSDSTYDPSNFVVLLGRDGAAPITESLPDGICTAALSTPPGEKVSCYCCPYGQKVDGGTCKADPCHQFRCQNPSHTCYANSQGKPECRCNDNACRQVDDKCSKCTTTTTDNELECVEFASCKTGQACSEDRTQTCGNVCKSDDDTLKPVPCEDWQQCNVTDDSAETGYCVSKQPCSDPDPEVSKAGCQKYCADRYGENDSKKRETVTGCCILTENLTGRPNDFYRRLADSHDLWDEKVGPINTCVCCKGGYKCNVEYKGCKCDDESCKKSMAADATNCPSGKGFCSTSDNICHCIP